MTETETDREIFEEIRARKPIEEIGQNCLERILSSDCAFDERRTRLRFLHISGLYSKVFEAFNQGLYLGLEMPYSFFIELLDRIGQSPPKDLVNEILESARTPEQVRDLIISKAWDVLDDRLPGYRKKIYQELEAQAADRHEQLMDRLSFYQNQRMVQEEQRLIERLRKLYPTDPRVIQAEQDFSERWARHVIAKAALDTLDSAMHTPDTVQLDADQWPMAGVLLEEAVRLTKENPRRAVDLTLMFWFLELYPQALIVLELGEDPTKVAWFRIEILLKLRRFVDALDELKTIETQLSGDSETTFAAIYLRAQALHGLGQESQALDLMKSLVNVRPEYRSARSFISKWSEGRL